MCSEWPICKLSDFINIKHGFAFKGEFFKDFETNDYLLTPGNFAVGGGFKSDKFKYYEGDVPRDYILNENDLVVTMTDLSKQADTLGYSALVPKIKDKKLLHNQRIGLVQLKENMLDKVFLYFLLRSREYRHHVVSTATGTTVKHTSPTKIISFEFRKPPLNIQLKIGRILLLIEKKISLNTQTNQTLEALAQALFKSWFVDFDPVKAKAKLKQEGGDLDSVAKELGMSKEILALFPDEFEESELGLIPKGWGVHKAEYLSEKIAMGPFGSNIKVSTFVDSGIPIISGQHLKEVLLTNGSHNYITEEHANKLKNSTVYSGDIIFTHAGSIGQVSLIPKKTKFDRYVISQRQFYLRPKKELCFSTYLIYFFRSPKGQHSLLSNASQVGVPSIARPSSHLKNIEIILPKFILMKKFDEICCDFFDKAISNKEQNQSLTQLRNTLLPKLLSGEITIESE